MHLKPGDFRSLGFGCVVFCSSIISILGMYEMPNISKLHISMRFCCRISKDLMRIIGCEDVAWVKYRIFRTCCMRPIIVGIVVIAGIVSVAGYVVSPYFTESVIDEARPDNLMMLAPPVDSDDINLHDVQGGLLAHPPTHEGRFVGVGDGIHDAQGMARVLLLDDQSQVLRLEDFRSTNGPGLYVYLSADIRASDFVSLGDLKANQGNQNYPIPAGTDLEKYDKVLIWCKPFGVLFGHAELMPQ